MRNCNKNANNVSELVLTTAKGPAFSHFKAQVKLICEENPIKPRRTRRPRSLSLVGISNTPRARDITKHCISWRNPVVMTTRDAFMSRRYRTNTILKLVKTIRDRANPVPIWKFIAQNSLTPTNSSFFPFWGTILHAFGYTAT